MKLPSPALRKTTEIPEARKPLQAIGLAARRSGRGIGLGDLKGIRERVKASRPQRARLGHCSFGQLQTFVAYKARRAGIPVLFVAPKSTPKGRPACAAINDKNRANQATFSSLFRRSRESVAGRGRTPNPALSSAPPARATETAGFSWRIGHPTALLASMPRMPRGKNNTTSTKNRPIKDIQFSVMLDT